jgi:hypothetical protein
MQIDLLIIGIISIVIEIHNFFQKLQYQPIEIYKSKTSRN